MSADSCADYCSYSCSNACALAPRRCSFICPDAGTVAPRGQLSRSHACTLARPEQQCTTHRQCWQRSLSDSPSNNPPTFTHRQSVWVECFRRPRLPWFSKSLVWLSQIFANFRPTQLFSAPRAHFFSCFTAKCAFLWLYLLRCFHSICYLRHRFNTRSHVCDIRCWRWTQKGIFNVCTLSRFLSLIFCCTLLGTISDSLSLRCTVISRPLSGFHSGASYGCLLL